MTPRNKIKSKGKSNRKSNRKSKSNRKGSSNGSSKGSSRFLHCVVSLSRSNFGRNDTEKRKSKSKALQSSDER
jgi:hypothetical protein